MADETDIAKGVVQIAQANNKLCTFKQAKLLKKHGFDTKEMPMSEASRLITALASNGWRRTPDMVAKPATAPVLEDVPF